MENANQAHHSRNDHLSLLLDGKDEPSDAPTSSAVSEDGLYMNDTGEVIRDFIDCLKQHEVNVVMFNAQKTGVHKVLSLLFCTNGENNVYLRDDINDDQAKTELALSYCALCYHQRVLPHFSDTSCDELPEPVVKYACRLLVPLQKLRVMHDNGIDIFDTHLGSDIMHVPEDMYEYALNEYHNTAMSF